MLERKSEPYLHAIVGPRFSGTEEELVREVRAHMAASIPLAVFAPNKQDTTGTEDMIQNYKGDYTPIYRYPNIEMVLGVLEDNLLTNRIHYAFIRDVDLFVDFGRDKATRINGLVNSGAIIVCTLVGLNEQGAPIDGSGDLLLYAEKITRLLAPCVGCGKVNGAVGRLCRQCMQSAS